MADGKQAGQEIHLIRAAASTNTISVVADETARDLISTPAENDLAYLKSEDRYDSYESAAWVDNGGDDYKQDFRTADLSEAFSVVDVTDNLTTGDGKETATVRAERSISVSAVLQNASVAVVGATGMAFVFNSVPYGVKSMNYSESYDEIDVTDSNTTGDGTETQVARATRESQIELVLLNNLDDIVLATAETTTMTFFAGGTVTGSWRPESLDNANTIDDAQLQTYNGSWQGAVTESLGNMTTNAVLPTLLVSAQGKTYNGNAIVLSKTVAIAIDAEGTVDYSIKFNGAVTKTSNA